MKLLNNLQLKVVKMHSTIQTLDDLVVMSDLILMGETRPYAPTRKDPTAAPQWAMRGRLPSRTMPTRWWTFPAQTSPSDANHVKRSIIHRSFSLQFIYFSELIRITTVAVWITYMLAKNHLIMTYLYPQFCYGLRSCRAQAKCPDLSISFLKAQSTNMMFLVTLNHLRIKCSENQSIFFD